MILFYSPELPFALIGRHALPSPIAKQGFQSGGLEGPPPRRGTDFRPGAAWPAWMKRGEENLYRARAERRNLGLARIPAT